MFHAVGKRMRAWSGDPPTLPSLLSRSRLTRTFALPRFGRATLCEAHFNPCDARTNGAVCWQIRMRLHPHCPRHDIRESQGLITARPRPTGIFRIIDKPLFSNDLWRSWGLNRKLDVDEFNRKVDEFLGTADNFAGEVVRFSAKVANSSGNVVSFLPNLDNFAGRVVSFSIEVGKGAGKVVNFGSNLGKVVRRVVNFRGAVGNGEVGVVSFESEAGKVPRRVDEVSV